MTRVLVGALALAVGGCQRAPIVQPHEAPGVFDGAGLRKQWAVMSAGSIESAFRGVRSVGFAKPSITSSDDSTEPPTERELFEIAIRKSIRLIFVESGYEWVEEGSPQRTLEIAFVLATEDGLEELEELFGLIPGFEDASSIQRGMLAFSATWPGRAEPLFRASIEGVGDLSLPLQERLDRIPEAVWMMLGSIPRGPVAVADAVDLGR